MSQRHPYTAAESDKRRKESGSAGYKSFRSGDNAIGNMDILGFPKRGPVVMLVQCLSGSLKLAISRFADYSS